MIKKIPFLLLFFISFFLKAQATVDSIVASQEYSESDTIKLKSGVVLVKTDSLLKTAKETENTLYPKKFNEAYQNKYKGKDFDYNDIKPHESFWSKLQRKLGELIESIFGSLQGKSFHYTEIILRIIAIIVVGILLYFIVKFFVEKQGNFFFGKKNRKTGEIRDEDLHENIHEINFPESILKFEKQGDYRSAVRYQFLFILKKLSDNNLISWNQEKTNKDYVADLSNSPLNKDFRNLSYIFDYVWYGEFPINKTRYLEFKNQFQNFNLK